MVAIGESRKMNWIEKCETRDKMPSLLLMDEMMLRMKE